MMFCVVKCMMKWLDALTDMIMQVRDEFDSGDELGIDFEEKAFYDILLRAMSRNMTSPTLKKS